MFYRVQWKIRKCAIEPANEDGLFCEEYPTKDMALKRKDEIDRAASALWLHMFKAFDSSLEEVNETFQGS